LPSRAAMFAHEFINAPPCRAIRTRAALKFEMTVPV